MGMNQRSQKSPAGIKCVIVGDGGVGKTSLLMSYTSGGIMMDYIPTCFDCYTVDMKLQDKGYTMTLIDTAGQETYDRLRTLSYYDTDVFVVCFSVADQDSFENVKSKWIQELKQYRPGTPFIMVATQSDRRYTTADDTEHVQDIFLHHNTETTKCVPTSKGKSVAKKLGAKQYLECSALKCEGVEDVFISALQTAVRPKQKRKSFFKSLMSAFKSKKTKKDRTVKE